MKKYNYFKVIQSKHAQTWDDESFYTCNSQGVMDKVERDLLKHDLKEYRFAFRGVPLRVIFRRELAQSLPKL